MQNARNLYFAGAREDSLDEEGYSRRAFVARLWRKWTETVTAMKMAWTLPPARRLELYFNMSTFLSQRRGIGYATARLFGKRPRETTCRQYLQAFSLLQRPAALYRDRDAFLGYYREKLSHLYEEGLISAKQYEAWHDPPPFEWHTWGETSHAAARDRAVREAHQILKGTSHRLSEGLTVVTSVDADLQVRTDSVLEARIERWPGAIGSFLLLKPNGFFRTYVVTSAGTQGDLDFITATEQPGSRIKIALYLLAVAHLHEQGYSAEDIFTYELPTRYVLREDGETKTIGSHCTKHGDSVDLHRAFAESCNGAAYAVANELLTPKVVSRFLAQFGIEVKSHEAIAMGSFSVSEEQLAELHNALINAYRYVPARIVERIQTRDGTVIYEAPREPQAADRHAIAPEVAWVVRHLMRETVRSGTATRLCNGLPDCAALGVGAKTGSSNGRVRRWRGVTGQIGWRGGMTMSLSLRADGPMPLSPHSAVPVAGGVLHTLKPLFE
jgi:membrane peptidoglycan carboxypeptidase